MPLYEYECAKCNTRFEILRGITQVNDEVKCPRCGADKPKKLLNTVCCGGKVEPSKGNLRFPT